MQRMNTTEIIVLIYKLNIKSTLIACKNIIKIKELKKLIIFKVIFERSKKILKFNDFSIKNIVLTTIL